MQVQIQCTNQCESTYFAMDISYLFHSMLNDETYGAMETMLLEQKEKRNIVVKKIQKEKKEKKEKKGSKIYQKIHWTI